MTAARKAVRRVLPELAFAACIGATLLVVRTWSSAHVTCESRLLVLPESALPHGWRQRPATAPTFVHDHRLPFGPLTIEYRIRAGATPHLDQVDSIAVTDGTSCPAAFVDLAQFGGSPDLQFAKFGLLFFAQGSHVWDLRLRTIGPSTFAVTYLDDLGSTSKETFVTALRQEPFHERSFRVGAPARAVQVGVAVAVAAWMFAILASLRRAMKGAPHGDLLATIALFTGAAAAAFALVAYGR